MKESRTMAYDRDSHYSERVNKRDKPQLREYPTLESGCRVFGAVEKVCNKNLKEDEEL